MEENKFLWGTKGHALRVIFCLLPPYSSSLWWLFLWVRHLWPLSLLSILNSPLLSSKMSPCLVSIRLSGMCERSLPRLLSHYTPYTSACVTASSSGLGFRACGWTFLLLCTQHSRPLDGQPTLYSRHFVGWQVCCMVTNHLTNVCNKHGSCVCILVQGPILFSQPSQLILVFSL